MELDPIAQCILKLPNANHIIAAIPDGCTPLSGGFESIVLALGEDRVVRIGPQRDRPAIPQILQPLSRTDVDSWMIEILPRVDTATITERDVRLITRELEQRQYQFDDPGTDNIGRLPDGSLVVIDPGAVRYQSPYRDFDERPLPAAKSVSETEFDSVVNPMLRHVPSAEDRSQIKSALRIFPIGALDRIARTDTTYYVIPDPTAMSEHAFDRQQDYTGRAGVYNGSLNEVLLRATDDWIVCHETAHAWDRSHGSGFDALSKMAPQFVELSKAGFDLSGYASDPRVPKDHAVLEHAAEAIRAYLNVSDKKWITDEHPSATLKRRAPRAYGLINALFHNDEDAYRRRVLTNNAKTFDDRRGIKDAVAQALAQASAAGPVTMTKTSAQRFAEAHRLSDARLAHTRHLAFGTFERTQATASSSHTYPLTADEGLLCRAGYQAVPVGTRFIGVPSRSHPAHARNDAALQTMLHRQEIALLDIDAFASTLNGQWDHATTKDLPISVNAAYRVASDDEVVALTAQLAQVPQHDVNRLRAAAHQGQREAAPRTPHRQEGEQSVALAQ